MAIHCWSDHFSIKIKSIIDLNDVNSGICISGMATDACIEFTDSEVNISSVFCSIVIPTIKINDTGINLKSVESGAINCFEVTTKNCTPLLCSTDWDTEPSESFDINKMDDYKWIVCGADPAVPIEDHTNLAIGIAVAMLILIAVGIYIVFFTKL